MQYADNNEGNGNDRYLIMAPVEYRINACGLCGENRTGITRTPVEAKGSSNCCGCRQAAYTKTEKNREHGNHKQHSQTRCAVDAQTDEHTNNPGAAHYEIRRF